MVWISRPLYCYNSPMPDLVNFSIYFDNAATTPIRPEVSQVMSFELAATNHRFGNSGSNHYYGEISNQLVKSARYNLAELLGCEPEELLFTSGATESNNLALLGIARANRQFGNHIVTSAIEHKAVLAPLCHLQNEGFEVSVIDCDSSGAISLESIQEAVRSDTILVSIMAVNNETGIMQPIQEIGSYLGDRGVLFHSDLAQYAGKFEIDFRSLPVDLASFSAHKFYGPKGSGLLYVRNRKQLNIEPLVYGGGQESGLRSGTLASHQILGLTEALRIAHENRVLESSHVHELKQRLLEGLSQSSRITVHGQQSLCSPYITNFSVMGVDASVLINGLYNVAAISNGATCSSGTIDPSHVLRSMGLGSEELYGAVRVSFGYYNTVSEVDTFLQELFVLISNIGDES